VEAQNVRQQCACYSPCFRRRISTCVLQRVRENRNEAGVAGRLSREVGISFLAGKKYRLLRQRAPISLNPSAACAVQGSGPKAKLFIPQDRIGNFQDDAAHVLVGEKVPAGELEVVEGAKRVEEEGVTAPANKEAIAAGIRDPWFTIHRDRRVFDDNLSAVTVTGGVRGFNGAQRRRT